MDSGVFLLSKKITSPKRKYGLISLPRRISLEVNNFFLSLDFVQEKPTITTWTAAVSKLSEVHLRDVL